MTTTARLRGDLTLAAVSFGLGSALGLIGCLATQPAQPRTPRAEHASARGAASEVCNARTRSETESAWADKATPSAERSTWASNSTGEATLTDFGGRR